MGKNKIIDFVGSHLVGTVLEVASLLHVSNGKTYGSPLQLGALVEGGQKGIQEQLFKINITHTSQPTLELYMY